MEQLQVPHTEVAGVEVLVEPDQMGHPLVVLVVLDYLHLLPAR